MIKIDKLNPFGRLCITLGMLPSPYKESLTYEEQLLWMLNYIEKTLIPTINNNAQVVEELQALYLELKSYVDSHFENLNVQQSRCDCISILCKLHSLLHRIHTLNGQKLVQ